MLKKKKNAPQIELAQTKTELAKMTTERNYYKKLAAVQNGADTVKPVVAKITAHLTGDGDDLDDVMIHQEGDIQMLLVLISSSAGFSTCRRIPISWRKQRTTCAMNGWTTPTDACLSE